MKIKYAALLLILAGCKNSADDPLPPSPNPPAVNQPPTANAGADQLVLTGAAVGLTGSGTDPDGSVASLAWTQTSGAAVTLAGASSSTPTFTAPAAAGTLVFSLTVTDNQGLARSDSVTVEVNAAPIANAGADKTVSINANVALSGSGTDANGSIASYAWTQTAGTAVTLTGGTTAAPTFTAPSGAGLLAFQLTVTDNQGATSSDNVNVMVNALAAPVIVRQPTNITAFEHGIGLIFVVAQGENLNYEWHYDSGAFWTSGPEPYMIRGEASGLPGRDDCYYVIVSNDAGSVTSEPGCMTVIKAEGIVDPSDDDNNGNASAAVGYGNSILEILRVAVGQETGPVYPGRTGLPWVLGWVNPCYGSTLDGVALTQATTLPLGHHTITEVWNGCSNSDPDEPTLQNGGIMITYDFPNEFGVGTYTMYLSGHGEYPRFGFPAVMNGILTVTSERSTDASNVTRDDFEVTLGQHFGAAAFRLAGNVGSGNTIDLHREYYEPDHVMTDARVSWHVGFQMFDSEGYFGTVVKTSGSNDIELHEDAGDVDDGEDGWSSEGFFIASVIGEVGEYYGARVLPGVGNQGEWNFHQEELPDPNDPVVD